MLIVFVVRPSAGLLLAVFVVVQTGAIAAELNDVDFVCRKSLFYPNVRVYGVARFNARRSPFSENLVFGRLVTRGS